MTQEEKAKAYDNVVGKLKQFMAQGVDPLITRADVQDFFPELNGNNIDYEKAYKEAFEKAKKLYGKYCINNVLESLFPELVESEGDRIRKELLESFKYQQRESRADKEWLNGIKLSEVVAWLEKQGKKEQDERYKYLEDLLAADDIYQMSMNDTMVEEARTKAIEAISKIGISQLLGIEKQSEQKRTDKVEPKFKVGDWCIDNEDGVIFQIVKVLDNTYTYKTNEGKEYSCTHYSLENDAKHWTIKDAKEGDILVASDGSLFIFAKVKDNSAYYHFSLCTNGSKEISDGNHAWERASSCHPATKEQRNLLFQEMKEAGYEWDAEKKELRKIEKQGEQKDINHTLIEKEKMDDAFTKMMLKGKTAMEAINEEKVDNANKIEPKFKVGDWIVNNNSGGVCQVTEIRDDEYCLWPLYAEIMGYLKIIDVDNDYHLWTIEDAKDGDVLFHSDTASNGIFIFKEVRDGKVLCHCDFDSEDHFRLGEYHNCCWVEDNIKLATKEQRELLFQKMKEAEYEWDAEKKELKKIEQKPIWSEEDERIRKWLICGMNALKDQKKETFATIPIDDCIAWLKRQKPVKQSGEDICEIDKEIVL